MKKIFPILILLALVFAFLAGRSVISQSNDDSAGLPSPWDQSDIGSVKVPGSSRLVGSTYEVSGSGGDLFGTEDAFHFVRRPWNGDGAFVARLLNLSRTNGSGKVGIMVR